MRERWARVERWEADQLAARPSDFAAALGWLAGARELARQLDPEWGSAARAEEHWRRLSEDQRTLARVRFPR